MGKKFHQITESPHIIQLRNDFEVENEKYNHSDCSHSKLNYFIWWWWWPHNFNCFKVDLTVKVDSDVAIIAIYYSPVDLTGNVSRIEKLVSSVV